LQHADVNVQREDQRHEHDRRDREYEKARDAL
jgi:hypothetical protein